MSQFDQLHRYIFDTVNVRGELVQLQHSYQAILDAQGYPKSVSQLMGELMAATSLLTATLKFEGDIAVQVQSDGIVKYAVVNGTHDQKMRGTARWDQAVEQIPTELNQLLPKGVLVINITPTKGERYQGMVSLDKPTLAECLEAYFAQSEQLATKIVLKTRTEGDNPMAGGLFLQVLPTSSEVSDVTERPEFTHLSTLTETISEDELLGLSAAEVLHRLYHQEDIQVYEPQVVEFKCTCSKERSAAALLNVDKQELLDIVAQEGAVTLNCQYCHTQYSFDGIDVESIYGGAYAQPSTTQ